MPGRGIQHIDLAVADVDRSLAFYDAMLGLLGFTEYDRTPSHRGTEEIVYLRFGRSFLGIRPADGGAYRHYDVGLLLRVLRIRPRRHTDRGRPRPDGHGRVR